MDFPDFQATESMYAFMDFNADGLFDVVAGFAPSGVMGPKLYQVAEAVNSGIGGIPDFGAPLVANTGGFFTFNNPATPAFEFNIKNFSTLYQQKTGQTLGPTDVLAVGITSGSLEARNAEAVITPKTFTIGDAAINCPPAEPPILINPHENFHINTAHPTDIRINIFGSAGFDVDDIIPETVRFGGASPIFSFTRFINKDKYPDATFVFRGTDVDLPPGFVDAMVTGTLTDFREFKSTQRIFNRDESFFSAVALDARDARVEKAGRSATLSPMQKRLGSIVDNAIQGLGTAGELRTMTVPGRQTVRITGRGGRPVPMPLPVAVVTSDGFSTGQQIPAVNPSARGNQPGADAHVGHVNPATFGSTKVKINKRKNPQTSSASAPAFAVRPVVRIPSRNSSGAASAI
jgi:hypothetical protein